MINKDQEYRSADPRDSIRIRVLTDYRGFGGKAWVGTVKGDGTTNRHRYVEASRLHVKPYGKSGAPRKTGYILVSEPSGE